MSSDPVRSTPDGAGATVGVVARMLGVSVRALHHWDALAVVSPSARSEGDYRLYSGADIARLRRVLLYRELGVPLERIRTLLEAPGQVRRAELHRRRQELVARMAQLEHSLTTVEGLLEADEAGMLLSAEEQVEIFGPGWEPEQVGAARELYQDTAQWAESTERAAGRCADDWRALAARSADLDAQLVAAKRAGVRPGTPRADRLAEQHRLALSEYFHCTVQMHVLLGRRYAHDPQFSRHFDRLEPGLADWLHAVIDAAARAVGVDPQTAVWG